MIFERTLISSLYYITHMLPTSGGLCVALGGSVGGSGPKRSSAGASSASSAGPRFRAQFRKLRGSMRGGPRGLVGPFKGSSIGP